jgi:gliding motility-associated-like protein
MVLSSQNITEEEWTPEEGLDCVHCLDPNVTVTGLPGTKLIYMFSGKVEECPVGAQLRIHIPPLQTIEISGDNVVCEGDVVQLTIDNPDNLSGFQWSVTSGNGALDCTTCPDPKVTVTGMPPIDIKLTAATSDSAYCGAEGYFQMVSGVQPQITGPTFFACLGGEVTIDPVDPDYVNRRWSVFNGDLTLNCDDCPNPVVTVNGSGRIRLDADVPSTDTCGVIVLYPVSVYAPDMSDLEVTDPANPPIGQGTEVTVTLSVDEGPPANQQWSINGTAVGGNTNIISFFADEEVNFVEVTYINSKGCEQTDTLTVFTVPPFYQIPNAFTPNADDKNDNFRFIITGNISIREFLIFNRWGQLVYEGAVDDLEGWDGTFKGEPASSDTYVYSAILEYPNGAVDIIKGDVMLIR